MSGILAGRRGGLDAIVGPMAIEIRRLRPDELGESIEALSAAFLERPDIDEVVEECARAWFPDRTWVAHDGDRICGTFRSWPTEITVPGGARLPAAAVSGVTVLPTTGAEASFAGWSPPRPAIRERGEVMALLHAAEYPIYGRFGTARHARGDLAAGQAVRGIVPRRPWRSSTSSPDRPPFRWSATSTNGTGSGRRARSAALTTAGRAISVDARHLESRLEGLLVLHRDDAGVVDGRPLQPHPTIHWDGNRPANVVALDELHALTTDAYATLWRSSRRWTGWRPSGAAPRRGAPAVAPGRRPRRAVDRRHRRHLGPPVRRGGALAARTYEREGGIVIEVVDAERAEGATGCALTRVPMARRASRRTEAAELTRAGRGARRRYLGGPSLRSAVPRGRRRRASGGGDRSSRRLLRTRDEPWTSTFF